jgi:LysR family transcriptional regulator, hypochlorite-specific transcription factor HypT
MQLKILEDFVALAKTGSFTAAARQRNVTHPAFGRRIKALEEWLGSPVVDKQRGHGALKLTEVGEAFLATATRTLNDLAKAKLSASRSQREEIRICTGRTLARTLAADWVTQQSKNTFTGTNAPIFMVSTASLQAAANELALGKVDFLLAYQHPSIELKLNAMSYQYKTIGVDKLVLVAVPWLLASKNSDPLPHLQYASGLALRKMLDESLDSPKHLDLPNFVTVCECDSPDAIHSLALKGLGAAWLPWSLVAADCRQNRLAIAGKPTWDIAFEIRLYRKRQGLSTVCEDAWLRTEAID